ncbi:MBL fold metallo-hydrolase [Halovenus salina]|uniref:MBL fold metallo-hydrolase n=1 Tax=Halovenus salina TaxID=1510225 RepID=A0ABD5W260_9EURY|nr:MBL fold metallo-hydrolase [Halovenus salina]
MSLPSGVHALPQTVEHGEMTTTVHPAAVETEAGLLLVDVGFPGQTDQIVSALAEAGFDWSSVAGIVLTHQDGDHAGSLASVLDETDAVVYAHEECAPYVDGSKEPIKSPDGERYPPARVDVELVDGVTFQTAAGPMEVVFTPGHAPGHISLYFPDRSFLIAGDALTATDGRLQGPDQRYTPEMDEALGSARDLAERDIDEVLCYHGGPVGDGDERIARLVEELS